MKQEMTIEELNEMVEQELATLRSIDIGRLFNDPAVEAQIEREKQSEFIEQFLAAWSA